MTRGFTITIALFLPIVWTGFSSAQTRTTEWPVYGNDPGGMRYSPLDEINRENVHLLEPAWIYRTGELDYGLAEAEFTAAFSATPLVIDGNMYFSTPSSRVISLDAESGEERWMFDPQDGVEVRGFNANRGVTYWDGPADDGSIERTVFAGTVSGRLYALDADTGIPRENFGEGGYVDLRVGETEPYDFANVPTWGARITSPPVIYRDVVISGWGLPEHPGEGPSGDVRAFDVRTGEELWRFHTVPRPGEYGHDTWEGDSWKNRMGANVWSIMSVDVENGMVFLPIGAAAYDFYGGDRVGQNLFANSLVALDAATGELIWYYQMVHHDLWDYDIPAQPNLITVVRDGVEVPAVAQVTKMGFVFVFNRLTGEPLFPIEHRLVPKSELPGEVSWPEQPFPVLPPPLARTEMSRGDISQVTPESNRSCTELFDQVRGLHIFTPLTEEPTVFFPGYFGGGNWSGASFDPASGYLFVNMNEEGALGEMEPQPADSPLPYKWGGRFGQYKRFADENGWPCQQPPWGTLNAVDLNTGEVVWAVPLGVVDELIERGLPPTGTQNLGGSIVTAGGVVFIAGTLDQRFRAFDAETGEELWTYRMEANGHATPITFQGRSGRQYVAIAAGGGGFYRELAWPLSDTLMVFSLPD